MNRHLKSGAFWSAIIIPVILGVYFYLKNLSTIDLCELETCPFCYGEDYCNELKANIRLNFYSFTSIVFNLLSVKNVYFGDHVGTNVVIKKLVWREQLDELNEAILDLPNTNFDIQDFQILLKDSSAKFRICDYESIDIFLKHFVHKNITHLWTILKVNVEPLLLELFSKEKWPLPKLLGYCGRAIVVEHRGIPLNELKLYSWYDRAYVALQLLEAAELFTFGNDQFRLYLLDISPDNVVVNPRDLKIAFVDLEHTVIQGKMNSGIIPHFTHHMDDEIYAFSTDEICGGNVSDHNIYSVCRLLLSRSAPWPMMAEGLLHSPPSSGEIIDLLEDIELCVDPKRKKSRFYYSKKIINRLKGILKY